QKTMTAIARQAPGADELRFWAKSAVGAIAEEKAMQEELFTNDILAAHRVEGLGMSLSQHPAGDALPEAEKTQLELRLKQLATRYAQIKQDSSAQ
ncbi:MAG: hypothetical protein E7A38_05460, partial [Leclercia adecarboxylata]|nr:hypothetical protein [Leclercia adecarboxylata]